MKVKDLFRNPMYPIRIYDSNNNEIYYENSDGFWYKQEFDSNNNKIYYENSNGYWYKIEYDSNNNRIYFEGSNGYWVKSEYGSNNNRIYYEESNGNLIDNRKPKELTMDEIAEKFGIPINQLKIKKQ